MILTHFILSCTQAAVAVLADPASATVLAGSSAVTIRPAGNSAAPVLRVGAAPAVLIVGRA